MLKKLQNNIEFFQKNGYVIIEDIYTPEECDLIINSAHDILGQSNKDLTPLMNIHKGSNRALITIEDDGPGIPEDQYKNVFKPFFRLDKSRSLNQSGVGLGLAIVEDIINSHGGNIQLGKSKYKGLQVKVSLPF